MVQTYPCTGKSICFKINLCEIQSGNTQCKHLEIDKTQNIHRITENSDKYGNVRGIVKKTRNF